MRFAPCLLVACFVYVRGAPSGQTVYDQKQTGDYNIQVHLKDFQIIALLGDEALGDYDYNYDYSDFTIAPPSVGNNVTQPSATEGGSSTTTTSINNSSTTANTTTNSEVTTSTGVPPSTTTKQEAEKATLSVPFGTSSPDKIKVQIIEEPSPIVAADEVGPLNTSTLSDVLHIRKCANGYTRDKKGRCRRVRRPGQQHQFASTLASRLRLQEKDSVSTSRSDES